MSGSLNRVQLLGHVGQAPKIKEFQNGGKIASFSIATSESWKDKKTGEKKTQTDWHNVSVQNEHIIGIVERFVSKGSKLYIEGQLKTRSYEDNGTTKYVTEVVMRSDGIIRLLDNKNDLRSDNNSQSQDTSYSQNTGISYSQAVDAQKKPADTTQYGYQSPQQAATYTNPMIEDEVPF